MQVVDWEAQWREFAENFYDGLSHIDLQKYGSASLKQLLLLPGPGFGDLSHPTTALMMELMSSYIRGKNVLDIGCGSGILSLAALLLGAKKAVGVDIDAEAVSHARKNAEKNGLSSQVHFCESTNSLTGTYVMLLNMIIQEQRVVMEEREALNKRASLWIVSGILQEQKEHYLELAASWGWKPILRREKEGWLAFVFKKLS